MKGILKKAKGILRCVAVIAPFTIWAGTFVGLAANLTSDMKNFDKRNDEFLNSEPVTQQVQQYKVENEAENAMKVYEAKEAFERGEISQDEYFAEIGEVENQEKLSDKEIVAKLYENDEQYNALLSEKDKLNSRGKAQVVSLFSTGAVAALGTVLINKKVLDSVDAETDAELEKSKREYEEARNNLEKEDKQVNEVKEEQSSDEVKEEKKQEDTKKEQEDIEPEKN